MSHATPPSRPCGPWRATSKLTTVVVKDLLEVTCKDLNLPLRPPTVCVSMFYSSNVLQHLELFGSRAVGLLGLQKSFLVPYERVKHPRANYDLQSRFGPFFKIKLIQ